MVLVGWGTRGEAGGSSCVTEKVVEYFLVFDNMVGEELLFFGLHIGSPTLILPFLVEIVMIYTSNHVSSSMIHASSKLLHKKSN